MAYTTAHLVVHVIPHVPARKWVLLSLSIPMRLLLASQPKLVAPLLQVVHRVIARLLRKQVGVKADDADSGAVTLTRCFGSAAAFRAGLRKSSPGVVLARRPRQ